MKNYESLESTYTRTFGKSFDRKAFAKLVSRKIKMKEDEFLENLINHFDIGELTALKEDLTDGKKPKRPNS